MKNTFNKIRFISLTTLIIFFIIQSCVCAQEKNENTFAVDTLILAAKEMILKTRYCALITLDESGHPNARTMDAFAPEEDLVVWMGTNRQSRKVKEIKENPGVTLYYQATDASGYVVIKGKASTVDDKELKKKYFKEEWNRFYPENRDNYLLIKVIPLRLEMVDYTRNITSKSESWAVPFVIFSID